MTILTGYRIIAQFRGRINCRGTISNHWIRVVLALLLGAVAMLARAELQEEQVAPQGAVYDIAINNGRVIDPETSLDAVRHVGIAAGRIASISTTPLRAQRTIDATGLVVSPGFIDLHAHGQSYAANTFQAHDGVTTALELETGADNMARWLASRAGNALINYGASASHVYARLQALGDCPEADIPVAEASNYAPLSSAQLPLLKDALRRQLEAGGLGIGVLAGYTPGASRDELRHVFEIAAEFEVPVFVHVRNPDLQSIEEVTEHAEATLASLHIVHINSMVLRHIGSAIDKVEAMQSRGFDIMAELYPYTAASTSIESALFDEGWRQKFGASYEDIQWQETGERLTETTFREYREKGGTVILHMMDEEWIRTGLSRDSTIVASDGMPFSPHAHPRSAGTFARVLGKYVREDGILTLSEAIEKMTLMPARRLEIVAPDAVRKGRIQAGADADITIFEPDSIVDQATFQGGLKFSAGIPYVIVNGVLVVDEGSTVPDVFPGRAIIGKHAQMPGE